jgi:hypothetical protein
MNNILNKIAQMERNAEEIKLASHKVELSIADKANKSLDAFRDGLFQKTSDLQDNLIIQIKDYNKKVEAAYKKFREIEKGEYLTAYTKITDMAKELGVAPNQIPDLAKLERAYNFNKTVFDRVKPINISQ